MIIPPNPLATGRIAGTQGNGRPKLAPGTIVLSPATYKAVLYADVEAFVKTEPGIREQMEGLHDDDISAIIATVDTDAIRIPERKRMVAFRTQVTVEAIRKSMAK